jgi:hypothetical protein
MSMKVYLSPIPPMTFVIEYWPGYQDETDDLGVHTSRLAEAGLQRSLKLRRI